MDPFAAGEVVQVPGSSASVHTSGLVAAGPPAHSTGYNGSDDDHTSSHGHASNHHGFSSISYRTGLSDSRGNLAQPESQFFYQPQKPAPPVLSPQLHPYNTTPSAMAVPLPATMSSSTYTTSSPYQVGVGQAHNIRQADLDANYYAGQIHYDTGAIAPTRSAGYAV
ncbi:hypothetical protein P691DRAFT_119994 [Macrolepiota fuliginosa MF-IS2]|uniref:Uncharacterized protein n=1 Tax=Macrolepiota fuliginosa MF-IS2 TaxID=1400762 RepID=A0A9P5XME5_9AGAR|nr:hypothetical protein P691DRAFT_119994 [Macrolepiota fuliginosa MF-IS2]